jgi:hypothetical protein
LTIEQGKLADPLYFDFISYVQFNVIARELPRSDVVFEERNGAEGTVSVIRRDASLGTDNKILTPAVAQRLGDALYARARFGFEDATFPGVPEPRCVRVVESLPLFIPLIPLIPPLIPLIPINTPNLRTSEP